MNHLTRRYVLRAAGVTILAGVTGAATFPKQTLTGQEIEMVLQVARLGAVYPVPFPDEHGVSRATAERLRGRLPELAPTRFQLVRDAVRDLAAAGLTGASRDRLLDGLAHKAADNGGDALTALTALAVATVSTDFSPNDDTAAVFWLGGLRQRHLRLKGDRRS
ncbi:hypothetical protein [Nonomuraea aurantiaca]|uniref:hypothetical protein n=1 Tax=Nonomuraea aurantiaca TaxID=2878562 RepID=UPI001CDA4559|nr:hypothetical protein [Nonomuraea aurantiaca]MCA2226572.1 hypothetical protein [Nonomuraea aurantiaca]